MITIKHYAMSDLINYPASGAVFGVVESAPKTLSKTHDRDFTKDFAKALTLPEQIAVPAHPGEAVLALLVLLALLALQSRP
jgi:hypothetical protein